MYKVITDANGLPYTKVLFEWLLGPHKFEPEKGWWWSIFTSRQCKHCYITEAYHHMMDWYTPKHPPVFKTVLEN